MPKTVYQTNQAGEFICEVEARESPLEPGVYMIPAGCVEAAPPDFGEHQAALWLNDRWSLVADHRGEVWYVGKEPVTVDFIGDPADNGYSATAPAPTLEDLRAAKLDEIVREADSLLTVGAAIDDGLHVALDDGSRADLTAMAATATAAATGAVAWPESYSRGWITIENVRMPLSTPVIGLILAARAGDYYAAIVQQRRDLKDAALAAESVAALDAIDVSAGWPGC